MRIELIDKKLENFKSYQLAIINSTRKDFLILSLVIMVLVACISYLVATIIHRQNFTASDSLGIFLIFPGPVIIGIIYSYFSYIRNRKKSVEFTEGKLYFEDTIFNHESFWFIEHLGPYVLNLQTRGMTGFRFVSGDPVRNQLILKEILKIKPDIQIKKHPLSK